MIINSRTHLNTLTKMTPSHWLSLTGSLSLALPLDYIFRVHLKVGKGSLVYSPSGRDLLRYTCRDDP